MNTIPKTPSILASLRTLIPSRDCDFDEALAVAERQATKLADLLRARDGSFDGIQLHHIAELPRIQVVYDSLPVSGMSYWNGQTWILAIAASDTPARQRFTLLHEFKHILDHGATARLYQGTAKRSAQTQAEQVADYFAGCALVPKTALKRAWGNGMQRLDALADFFGVSEPAMQVRLDQTGLSRETDPEPTPRRERCARPVTTPSYQAQRFRVARPCYGQQRTRRSYA